jgi:two-component system cell cycle response regulator
MESVQTPRVVRYLLFAMGVWVLAYAIQGFVPSHPLNDHVLGKYASDVVQMLAGALCVWRGLVARSGERAGWILIGAGIIVWTVGDVYWAAVLVELDHIPVPSLADVGYIAFVPLTFAGIVLLIRARIAHVPRTLLADGLSAALAVGAVSAAIVVEAVLSVGGSTEEILTNLAYPVVDMTLMALIVATIALRGWRMTPSLALMALGTLAYWGADSLYLIGVANDTYAYPSAFDFGWTAAGVLYAAAAWAPTRGPSPTERSGGLREVLLPIAFGVTGLGVLVAASFTYVNPLAVVLAALSLLAVLARLLITFAENAAMLRASRAEALTDALTGLGNRRALTLDLEKTMPHATDGEPLVLVLFDLDGFKHYNDSFGHPAGDELLSRLGRNLDRVLSGRGKAYRMGGDEFCALIHPGVEVAQPIVETAAGALSDHGDGFRIGCSYGSIALPREAPDVETALRMADQRMYAAKNGGRTSAGRQSTAVLLRALSERDPYLGDHTADVANLAEAVAERLGLATDEVEQVSQAAELHDIGKVAIPDAILHKPGPLDEREWAFIRGHTLIGERIIDAAPALGRVAALVRSSHERFDGGGYPDGLAGQDIPLGSRIVAICDAFDAMTTDRAYRAAMTPDAALLELRDCAGSQFDPVVVEAFCAAWAARGATLTNQR